MASLAFPLSIDAVTPSQKATLGEAMPGVSDHLLLPHMPLRLFQEDLLHDLPRHRGEAHQPVVPWVLLSPFLKNASDMFTFFQSPGTSLHDSHYFLNMMESGLAIKFLETMQFKG